MADIDTRVIEVAFSYSKTTSKPLYRGSLAIQMDMILLLPMTYHAVNELFVTI